jgi:Mn-dependent DtxR family transcriptional regulator
MERPHLRVDKAIIKKLGRDAALLFAELIDEERYYIMVRTIYTDNYFYSTSGNIEERLGMSPKIQRKAIKILVDANLLVQDNRRKNSKTKEVTRFFRIKHENLKEFI